MGNRRRVCPNGEAIPSTTPYFIADPYPTILHSVRSGILFSLLLFFLATPKLLFRSLFLIHVSNVPVGLTTEPYGMHTM